MQQRTARIMKVLAAFEESAANCISQTVVYCANNNPNEGVAQAARFLVHVDALYNGIDVVETKLAAFGDRKVLQHDKEPKELAKQLVALFTLLSTQSPDAAQSSRGKVTELARLLKYMITAGLRGAIKLVSLTCRLSYCLRTHTCICLGPDRAHHNWAGPFLGCSRGRYCSLSTFSTGFPRRGLPCAVASGLSRCGH